MTLLRWNVITSLWNLASTDFQYRSDLDRRQVQVKLSVLATQSTLVFDIASLMILKKT